MTRLTTIKPGDVVEDVIEGPAMTVSRIDGDSATCLWFDENGQFRTGSFLVVMLQHRSFE
jgi:uncharacterized protein YodC (DUF2158 family)